MRRGLVVVATVVAVAGCAASATREPASAVAYFEIADSEPLRYDLAFADRSDVAVVLLHGFDDDARASMGDWADELATTDSAVLNGDWMPAGSIGTPPTPSTAREVPVAVACLIDTARSVTDHERVVVVGVSAGAYQAVLAATIWNELDRSGCDAPPSDPPDVIIALAGAFDAARRGPLAAALGSSPDTLLQIDPFSQLTQDDAAVRLVIVHGDADPIISPTVADDFATVAERAGWEVDIHRVDGGEHFPFGSPTSPEGSEAAVIVRAVVDDT